MEIDTAIMFCEQVASGCTSGRFSEWPQLRPACQAVVARIAELEAVVAKLPETADGVPVVPGNEAVILWSPCGEPGHLHFDPQVGWIVWGLDSIACAEQGQEFKAPPQDRMVWPKTVFDCYSTRLAAEQAKG